MTEAGALIAAMGLGSASGLNLHLPLLILGLSSKFSDAVNLPSPYSVLEEPWLLGILAVLALAEFIGDKIPGVDHALHLIGTVLHPVAGALVFLATTQGVVDPKIAVAAGILLAGTTHAARSVVRPASTATTAGVGNPFLSALEDGMAGALSISALFLPLLAILMLAAMLFAVMWAGWRLLTRKSRAAASRTT